MRKQIGDLRKINQYRCFFIGYILREILAEKELGMLEKLKNLKVVSWKALKAKKVRILEEKLNGIKTQQLEILEKKFPKFSELKKVFKNMGVKDDVILLCSIPFLCVMGALAGSMMAEDVIFPPIPKKEVKN